MFQLWNEIYKLVLKTFASDKEQTLKTVSFGELGRQESLQSNKYNKDTPFLD